MQQIYQITRKINVPLKFINRLAIKIDEKLFDKGKFNLLSLKHIY